MGNNYGTVTNCRFDGYLVGSIAGGIAGENSGTISNCNVLVGRIDNKGVIIPKGSTGSTGGIIGLIPDGINFTDVIVTGNTYSRTATGQQSGIGQDNRLSPAGPSDNGTTPLP